MADSPKAPVGGCIFAADPITFNESRPSVTLKVRNTGDRPIQVGSHFHFFEVNRALEFDRAAAYGMRLNIPSTTAMRFEPGDEKTVSLVPYGGLSGVYGFNNLVDAWTGDEHGKAVKIARALALGFKSAKL
ncbi:urease subunit beta [uncultured Mailhella sp.]|uniref:urease subunit beta n=1 Tax=uncultured Mailhella sp. TaxID=1981031 RepID=UPI0025E6226D|nr:urease subunit beta [uncultured Mailhella sp.]